MAFTYDRSAPWYYGADGQAHQAVNDGSGWTFPLAPVGEDGQEVRYVDDPALINQRVTQLLGYNPDDKIVNQDGSGQVLIRNAAGQYEPAAWLADGNLAPASMATGENPVVQMATDPKPEGGGFVGQVKEGFFDSGAYLPFAMAAGVNLAGGANAFGTNPGAIGAEWGATGAGAGAGSGGGATLSAVDVVNPTSVATGTATEAGMGGAQGLQMGGGGLGLQAPTTANLATMGGAQGLVAPAGASWAGAALPAAVGAGGGVGSFLGGTGGTTTLVNAGIGSLASPSFLDKIKALLPGGSGSGSGVAEGTALSRLFDGSSSVADWAKIAGALGGSALGAYASNKQADALTELANKYMEFGAPSRARYEGSFAPGFDLAATDPAYKGALDSTMDATLRRLSTQGNPFGSPGGLIEANKAIVSGTALPALNEYRRLNAGTGGLAALTSAAPAASSAAIGANTNVYNAIGSGIADITNPKTSFADLIKKYGNGMALA